MGTYHIAPALKQSETETNLDKLQCSETPLLEYDHSSDRSSRVLESLLKLTNLLTIARREGPERFR